MAKGNPIPSAKVALDTVATAALETVAEPEPEPPKMVKKIITCTRCSGSGTWFSSRTGVRKKTAVGPLADPKRTCPRCRGTGKTHVMITEEQAAAEKEATKNARHAAKAKIDVTATAAKKAIDAK